jgi:hypothetical protein
MQYQRCSWASNPAKHTQQQRQRQVPLQAVMGSDKATMQTTNPLFSFGVIR